MDNYIGRLLDNRYEILEMIGSGGMAVVYKARCHRLNRFVAIKILKDEFSQDAEFRRRFHAESQAVAMLSHPNIVSVYDVSHSDGIDYIVMELIEGITLKQYMEQKGQLNWREALHFATQIAKALEHAHSRGIIHRDIKPHNIMILKDGSVKVADFGIARISSAQNTLTREALGSVHYISPEQAKGGHVDFRTDLYSLGVVMYEMLTGRPPFDGDTPVSVAIQHINAKPVMPRELNPSIPLGLEQITMHAMTADLNGRYATATDMLADLEEFRKNPNITFDFSRDQGDMDVDRLLNETSRPGAARPAAPRSAAERAARAPAPKKPAQAAAREPEPARKSSHVATIAGIICIVLAIVGIGYFLYSYFLSDLMKKTAEDTVPNFVGMNMSDIDETKYPNFALDYSNQQASDQYPSGYIIAQSPDADSTAKVGTTIKLTVSTGPETNTMPDLVNKSEASAKSYLDKMAIQVVVSVSYEQNDDYTDGYVIRTDPEANASLTAGQTVTLFVCQKSDEEMVPVPALVGMDVDDALALIDSSNLGRGDVRSIESDLPEGTVTFQSIDEGEKVKSGTTINLQVSKGPEEAAAPVVKYLTGNSTVQVGDTLTLQIQANTTDEGVLTYAWYVSKTGSTDDGQVVSASAEGNTTCTVDTSAAGSSYYFCKITNTLGKATATTYSNMVYVTVEAKQASTLKDKVLAVEMPSSDGVYDVTVKVGGVQQQNFEVDMSQVEGTVISIQVSGTGSQVVDVYVDGQLQSTQTVDFGS